MPRARVTAARLAQVVCDSSGTRHARRRTYGGDPQLELVTIEAVEHRKIGHASARAEICSGIVAAFGRCVLGLSALTCARFAGGRFPVRTHWAALRRLVAATQHGCDA